MTDKIKKKVLIVDDKHEMCEILREKFIDCLLDTACPYEFEVKTASSAAECVKLIRDNGAATSYHVVVLDILMEGERSGLEASFAIQQQQGSESPVRIIFTGHARYSDCVEAMRNGAWDYIVKEDVLDTPMTDVVVNSAVARLRQVDLRREQDCLIASKWLPFNILKLQEQYEGKLVAVWHLPEIDVIASGVDAFDLEAELKQWRSTHETWEQPFIVQVPLRFDDFKEEN